VFKRSVVRSKAVTKWQVTWKSCQRSLQWVGTVELDWLGDNVIIEDSPCATEWYCSGSSCKPRKEYENCNVGGGKETASSVFVSSTLNLLLSLISEASAAENLQNLDMEFLRLHHVFKFACSTRLLLPFTAFNLQISSLTDFNLHSRYLILYSWCLACFVYLHGIQSHGMLLPMKLELLLVQFVEGTVAVFTSKAIH
jgi:hypothetical protein